MNRKQRRANKIPPQPRASKPPEKKYAVTYAGSSPDVLSRKERSIVLAMTSQVPFAVNIVENNPVPADEADPPFSFDDLHVHVILGGTRRVCLRWKEADIPGVFEGQCESLGR